MGRKISDQEKNSCLEFKENPVTDGIKWEDVTSYSRDDNERIPTLWKAQIGKTEVSIACGHIFIDGWIMFAEELGFDKRMLKAKTAREAAVAAIKLCKQRAQRHYKEFFGIE